MVVDDDIHALTMQIASGCGAKPLRRPGHKYCFICHDPITMMQPVRPIA
jgi:hypothetical protein